MSQSMLIFALWGVVGGALAQEARKLTMDDIFASDQFRGNGIDDLQWLPDGKAFVFTRSGGKGGTEVWLHDVVSGKERAVLRDEDLLLDGKPVERSAFQTTGDADVLLLCGKRKQIWRHSFSAPYYLYRVSTKQLQPLAGGDPDLQNAVLSPDGKRVAYVKGNNLYVADVAGGTPRALTHDGSADVLNGVFDWVYEEEFERADAFRWSPEGDRIAFWFSDQTRVKSVTLLDELPAYPEPFSLKYPKVGERNSIVKIGIANLADGTTTWVDLGAETDIYVPRIDWSGKPGQLMVQRLNRHQNHLEFLLADAATGTTRKVVEDISPTWVSVTDNTYFLAGDARFVWTSERTGWRHVYLSDLDGKTTQLTQGDWEVSEVLGVDKLHGQVYFAALRDGALEQGLFKVGLEGGEPTRLSAPGEWHRAVFSPDFAHYVDYASSVRRPTHVELYRADGKALRTLEANPIAALAHFAMVYPEFLSFQAQDGQSLNAYLMKPSDFDPTRKYPVVVFGYGGPGSQMVVNRWGTGEPFRSLQRQLWHQYLTEQGYLVFCVDNRGTGGRGKAFKNLVYGDISKWAVADQLEGARFLASLPYVDASRLGFWGWSGGGYLTCLMLTRGADVFKVGVAVASVGDFRNYDSIWTERYMGLPDENRAGYDAADVLRTTDQLKGRLLLVHGTGDDNVHPGNTWQIIEKLIAENKRFDMLMYPNRNHRIQGGNTSRHLHTAMARYFIENL